MKTSLSKSKMCLTLSNSYTYNGVHGVKTIIVMEEVGSVVNDDQIELFEKKQETERKRTIEMLIVQGVQKKMRYTDT